MLPVSRDGLLRLWEAFEAAYVEIENREFVFGEDVGVGLHLDATPDVADGLLEVLVDVWVEVAFSVASDIDGTLVV